jgi:hypothetical protein
MTILDVLPLFGTRFTGECRAAWRAFLGALTGMVSEPNELVTRCTGRDRIEAAAREAWVIVGRRGGKSEMAALIAVYLACFRTYALAPGEVGTVMILAADRKQARVVKRYISGLLQSHPMLAALVANDIKTGIELTNGIVIEIHSASFRAVRGYTVVAAICDEIAFWPTDDSAEPDTEILNALRPAMATVPDALLLCISSPYARRGELWKAYREHHGKDGDVLVWQADTRTMNPAVPQAVIDRAMVEDEAKASAEYGAQFRRDLEALFDRQAIEACVRDGQRELAPVRGVSYRAFVDPSGGSADSMTLAIAHTEKGIHVLDAVREVRPPFSPDATVKEFAALLKTYWLSTVTGDRYAGEWPREQFRKCGIHYQVSSRTRSDLYLELLPLINSGRVELLDHLRLVSQLATLERRTGRGKDAIDHAPGAHDDIANAVAGALTRTNDGSEITFRHF